MSHMPTICIYKHTDYHFHLTRLDGDKRRTEGELQITKIRMLLREEIEASVFGAFYLFTEVT